MSGLARGLECEHLVRDHYIGQGYEILAQRYSSFFAEIDLIFLSPQKILTLVEVKSVSSGHFVERRVTRKQKERLRRAFLYICGRSKKAEFHLAMVSQDNGIHVIRDFLVQH